MIRVSAMNPLFRYYFTTFTRPEKAFEMLLNDERYFRLGFIYILIPIIGYTLMYIFLTIGHGAPSVFTPWLNIPKESYYAVNRFLLAPSMVLSWFVAASVIQVLSRGVHGKGTFEQTLAVTGLSIGVAMWGGLIHDLPMSFLSAIHVIDARQHETDMNAPTVWRTLLWIAYSIYAAAFFILFTKAVRVVHKTRRVAGMVIGSLGFILFQLVFLIFNR